MSNDLAREFARFENEVERHKRRRARRLGMVGVFCVVMPAVAAWYFNTPKDKPLRTFVSAIADMWSSPDLVFAGRDSLNVVLIGIDVNRDRRGMPYTKNARSDTILVVHFDRLAHKVSAISIPRDTLATIPHHYTTKINAAHALGGPELLLDTLSQSLGIAADYYIKVKFAGLEKAVDAVGGVDLYVEKDMDYDDNWGQLHIHLRKGFQHLDGAKAHQYARFRHDAMGDIGRVARQQKLLKALARKILSPEVIPRIPRLIRVLQQNVETNLTTAQLLSLAAFMKSINPDTIETETLPGVPRGGYWVVDSPAASVLLSRLLGSTFTPSVLAMQASVSPPHGRSSKRHASAAAEPPLEPTAIISTRESEERGEGNQPSGLPSPAAATEPVVIDSSSPEAVSPTRESGKLSRPRDDMSESSRPNASPQNGVQEAPQVGKAKISPESGRQVAPAPSPGGESLNTKPEPPSLSAPAEAPPAHSRE